MPRKEDAFKPVPCNAVCNVEGRLYVRAVLIEECFVLLIVIFSDFPVFFS